MDYTFHKHAFDFLLYNDKTVLLDVCNFVSCISILQISCSTTSQRCSIGFRSGDWHTILFTAAAIKIQQIRLLFASVFNCPLLVPIVASSVVGWNPMWSTVVDHPPQGSRSCVLWNVLMLKTVVKRAAIWVNEPNSNQSGHSLSTRQRNPRAPGSMEP